MSTKTITQQALGKRREAKINRRIAQEHESIGDELGAEMYFSDADELEQAATVLAARTSMPLVSAGEVIPEETGTVRNSFIRSTLKTPDTAAMDASVARTDLLLQDDLDIAALAVDAANSVHADNSLEKMLIHQMSAAHQVSMTLMDRASGLIDHNDNYAGQNDSRNVNAIKMFNSAMRMMNSYQQGLLALNKIRNGGNQTVTIQHVNVSQGGQAVIGNLASEDCTRQGTNRKGSAPHE